MRGTPIRLSPTALLALIAACTEPGAGASPANAADSDYVAGAGVGGAGGAPGGPGAVILVVR